MSSFDEIRSGLLKKYNVSPSVADRSAKKDGGGSQIASSGNSEFDTVRKNLLEKYSDENVQKRRNAVSDWSKRYYDVINGVHSESAKSGNWYTRQAVEKYGSEIASLVREYDRMKDYADRKGLPNAFRYVKNLQEIQKSIQREDDWYQKYRGSGVEDVASSIANLGEGDERDWLTANRYEIYKSNPDFANVSMSGLKSYESEKIGQSGNQGGKKSFGDIFIKSLSGAGNPGSNSMTEASFQLASDKGYQQPREDWTDEQRSMYGYLYAQNKEKAAAYAQEVNDAYNAKAKEAEARKAADFATDHPVISTAGSVLGNAAGFGMADMTTTMLEKIARGTVSQKDYLTPHQYTETATGAISQDLNNRYGTIDENVPVLGGKGLGDAYQIANSFLTSMATAHTVGTGTDFIFFGNAAASTIYDAMDKGATDEQAIALGLVAGAAEAMGEHFSVSHLLGLENSETVKPFLKNILSQSFVEGEEEVFTSFINNLADYWIMGDKSQFKTLIAEYLEENPDAEDKDAVKYALTQMGEDMAFDFLGGAASGGAGGVVASSVNNFVGNQYYHDTYGSSQRELVQEAMEIDPNRKVVQEANRKLDGGKDLSGRQLREIVESNDRTVMEQAVRQRLTEMGETGDTDTISRAISKQARSEELSFAEKRALKNSSIGEVVSREVSSGEIWDRTEELWTGETTGKEEAAKLAEEKVPVDERERLSPKLQETGLEVPDTVSSKENEAVSGEDESAEEASVEPVTLESLSQKYGKQAKAMQANYMDGQDVEEYDRAFQMAYDMGKAGVNAEYVRKSEATSYLSESQREIAYQIGADAASAAAKDQTVKNAAAANGKTGWRKGIVKGMDVKIADMVKAFNDPQRQAYKYLSNIAEVTGVDIVLYKSDVGPDDKFRGSSEGSFKWNEDTVYIDINAGLESYKDAESVAKYTMMRVFDHEFTHFIEKWNPEGYNDFRKIVFEEMESNGENVEDLIDTMQAKSGGKLTYDQASREVVAEAMTDILPQTSFIEQLAQKNRNVFEQLLSKLKEFMGKLKSHFSSMGEGTREAKALKRQVGDTVSYMEDIVKKFDSVAVKAVENYQRTVAEDTPKAEKISSKEEETTPKAEAPVQQKPAGTLSFYYQRINPANSYFERDGNGQYILYGDGTVAPGPELMNAMNEMSGWQDMGIFTLFNPVVNGVEVDPSTGKMPSGYFRAASIDKRASVKKNAYGYYSVVRKGTLTMDDGSSSSAAAVARNNKLPEADTVKTKDTKKQPVRDAAPSQAEPPAKQKEAPATAKSMDAYDEIANALRTANIVDLGGLRFGVQFTPGADIYTGTIDRVEKADGYPVSNARNRIYTSKSMKTRNLAIEDIAAVARNDKLLDMEGTFKETSQANQEETKADQTPSEKLAASLIADYINPDNISKGRKKLTSAQLYALSDKAFGGTQAQGIYNRKDAYDALELAVNRHLLEAAKTFNGDAETAVNAVTYMQNLLELLPTQSVRTQEQQDFQQFSTPPNIAYLAAWAANINESDSVLEPSAGIGGLAVFAKAWGAEVTVNELSKRRLEVLRSMGFDQLFNENAEQIDNILPETVSPSVVIMNPPFSSTAGRTRTNKTSNAEKHIDQALARLKDGGRLVAILGKGMNNADYSRYWDKLRKEYTIRANLSIDGENYKKYGTTWGVQLVVIDKTGPQTGDTITGSFTDLTEVPSVLEGIRNDRSASIEQTSAVAGSESIAQSERTAAGQNSVSDTAGVVDQRPSGNRGSRNRIDQRGTGSPARSDVGEQRGSLPAGNRTDERDSGGSSVQSGRTGKSAEKSGKAAANEQRAEPAESVPASGGMVGNAVAEPAAERDGSKPKSANRTEVEPSDDGVYATFVVPDMPVNGGKPHPATLVESAAMAAVSMPKATYSPKLPANVVKNNLSDAQMVSVTYAGQAHSQTLPDGRRKGFFIGDGTGVGKGRQIAGIILDNFMQGRTKAVWISKNNDLYADAIRDWTATTGRSKDEVLNHSKIKPKDKIELKEGILYSTYDTVKSEKGGSRLDQIVEWVGKDFDGVIAFDEAHNMGNLFGKKSKFGKTKGSEKAKAGIELQRRLPNARIVYVSATAATEVDNLAYAERIGLWGQGTAFNDAQDFISKIGSSGLAAMELVIRDMKAMGVYVARSISYNGVNYDTVEHPLTPMQTEIYDTMSKAWQKTMANVQTALVSTGGQNNSTARQRAMGNFYSSMQRFYNQVLTSMSMPSVIADMRKELEAGHSCVLQIVNTNEAQQNKQLAEAKAEGKSLDELDMTPREALIGYLMNSFPVQMFEDYTDEDGNLRSRPVFDSNGKPVLDRKAVRQRDALIEEVNQMSIPDGPLEMLFDAFGTEAVAENTGRSRRVVPKKMPDGTIQRVEESRTLNHRTADVQAFQDGKKRILVFSDAGGTGKSYHAALNEKNQQQRVHYVLQPGWVASNAVQGFGRTHRSNEASAPIYKLVTTNIKGQKRFTSTIARRLDQLGALTKGQRDTGSGMFGTKDNLETDLAKDSLREFYLRLGKNQIEGINGMKTLDRLGLKQKFTDEYGGFKINDAVARDIGTFLNRILSLEVDEQNTVFDAFISIYEMELEAAMQAGTLDTGMENVKADKIEIVDDKVIREGSSSSASTHYIQAKTYTKPKVVTTVAEMAKKRTGFEGVYKLGNGSVRAVFRIADRTTEWGAIQKQYRLIGPNQGASISIWNENTLKAKATAVERVDWQKEWDAEVARVPEYNESTLHMLTGALLPIWNSLPQEGNTKVKRLIASDGSIYLGRVIDGNRIDGVLRDFGVGRTLEKYSGSEAYDKIMGGARFQLANRMEIERSRVSGEWRIEVTSTNSWYLQRQYPGIYSERISYANRYFIPTGEKGKQILERILADNPVRNVVSSDSVDFYQYRQRTNTLTDREVLAIAANNLSTEGMSEAERSALEIFLDRLAKLEDLQERRAELGRQYREQQFGSNVDRAAASETLEKMHAMDAGIRDANDKVLSVEEKSVLRDVLKKARKIVEQKQKEHDDEILLRWRDRRNNAAAIKKYREQITKNVKDISDWLLNPSNKNDLKHVPDALKSTVIPFLTSIDFSSKRQLSGGQATQADRKFVERLKALEKTMREMTGSENLYSGYVDLPPDFMGNLSSFVSAAQEIVNQNNGQFVINQMTSQELKELSGIVNVLKKHIQNFNRFHANAVYQHVYDAGDATIAELKGYTDAKSRSKVGETVNDFIFWQQIRPAYAFERFGSGGKAIYDELRRGQAKLAFNTKEIVEFSKNAYTDKEVDSWEKEVKEVRIGGETVKMKVSQIMSFYELLKREQARGHIFGQGIRVSSFRADGKVKVSDVGHRITIDEANRIIDVLTPRQIEVADKLQKYMQEKGGEWGNYVTVKRFGERIFGEENYFPINSDGRNLETNVDEKTENASLYALLNMGFTKKLQKEANNRVVLYSIFDVFSNHMASMAQYNAMALPVLDTLKWFNYQQKENVTVTRDDGTEKVIHQVTDSVKSQLDRVYGVPEETRPGKGNAGYAANFITGILKAFSGTETQGIRSDSAGLNFLRRYNMAQVSYNLRVVMQQPLAITRAAMIIDYSSIIRGLKLSPAAIRQNIQEMQTYSGIAAWKDLGFYDTNISRGLTDIIKHSETRMDKVREVGMLGAEKADQITWAAMWNACKEEVQKKYGLKPGRDGFFEAVTSLFEEVIYKTQVVDSVLTKNSFLRSKGFWARATGSFMSEPTTTASMLADAFDKYRMDLQKPGATHRSAWEKNWRNIGRTAYVYGIGAVLLAAVQAVADAFRDDDDYEKYGEKWQEAFIGNVIDELMPFNKLPIIADVYELSKEMLRIIGVDTYGNMPNSYWMQWTDSLVKGTEIIYKKITKDESNKYTWFGGIFKYLQTISGITGFPLAAATREIVTAWNSIVGSMAPSLKIKSYDPGEMTNIKYAYLDGYLTDEEATAELLSKKLVSSADNAYWKIREWNSGTDDYSRYDSINQAVRNGAGITDEMAELTSHGYSEKDVLSQIKQNIGEWFRNGYITEQQSKDMLKQYTDMKEDDISDTVTKWHSYVDTGISYDSIKEEYLDGTIDADTAIDMYVKYGGLKQEDAERRILEFDFEKEYGVSWSNRKEAYVDGDISRSDLRKALMDISGKTGEEADDYLDNVDFEIKYGFSYSDRQSAYLNGVVSRPELKNILINERNYDEDYAELTLDAYDWIQKHPQYDYETKVVISYLSPLDDLEQSVEEFGIPIDIFAKERSYIYSIESDKDENGDGIPYSRINKAFPYINDLPLTAEQKTAFAVACGWSLKTVNKKKLW